MCGIHLKKILRLISEDKDDNLLNDQRGQAMVYIAIVILVLVAGAFAVYDIGKLVNARIQFQNAADASSLAAVSIKVNKHHVEELMRAAMTQESIIAQSERRAAQAVLLQMVTDAKNYQLTPPPANPDGTIPSFDPKDYEKRFKSHVNQAYRHITKFHRERLALDAYYKWLQFNGPTAVREAAQIAFQANIKGYDDTGNPVLRKNVFDVLAKDSQLMENSSSFTIPIGGVIYPAEGSRVNGNFGKSYIETPAYGVYSQNGSSLLKYFPNFTLNSISAAQIASNKQLNTGETPVGSLTDIQIPGIDNLTSSMISINWYSPRLMAVEKREIPPFNVAH